MRAACLLVFTVLLFGTAGCTSLYRRSRAELPPEPAGELSLRMAETGRAEKLVRAAGVQLFKHLQSRKPDSTLRVDFDRLEAAAYDLDRREVAARETAGLYPGASAFGEELDRFRHSADAWLGYIRKYRTAEPTSQLEHLKALLAGREPPAE